MGIIATYVSTSSFTVVGDRADEFNNGRRVRATCSGSYDYGTVVSGVYSSPNTTITLTDDSDDLNIGLTSVYYGVQKDGIGSLPEHTHDGTEGEGGDITYSYWKSFEPFLDENYSNDKGVPTVVDRGLFKGYSMPIWNGTANVYEELLYKLRIPFRWDGVTNPWFCAISCISATEDIGDKYKIQLEWQSGDVGEVLQATTAETLISEVTVTDGTAYFAYILLFEMDATKLIGGQNWQARLRRVAASSLEVSSEPIIWHWCTRWKMNKLGTDSVQGY